MISGRRANEGRSVKAWICTEYKLSTSKIRAQKVYKDFHSEDDKYSLVTYLNSTLLLYSLE